MSVDISGLAAVKQQNANRLLKQKNVVGVGIGYKESEGRVTDEVAITVNVAQKVPSAQLAEEDKVPSQVAGIKTDVVETGRFLAGQADQLGPTGRWRPIIPPGVSIGHFEVTAGTLGCLVQRGNEIFLLSNNHVLANVNLAKLGDPIIQPARYDGGSQADDKIAQLAEYVPLDFGDKEATCGLAAGAQQVANAVAQAFGSSHRLVAYQATPGQNLVDAALARPMDPDQFSPDILKIGPPKGVRQASLGDKVQKSGRTTGHTTGQIVQVDVTMTVDYRGKAALFTDQLLATGMSAGGDSGSAVLDQEGYVVGLLYAGSGTSTLFNPIQTVLQALNVALVV